MFASPKLELPKLSEHTQYDDDVIIAEEYLNKFWAGKKFSYTKFPEPLKFDLEVTPLINEKIDGPVLFRLRVNGRVFMCGCGRSVFCLSKRRVLTCNNCGWMSGGSL